MNTRQLNRKTSLALALALLSGAAAAQSTVTVFGVADAAYRYANTDNVGSINSLVSGSYSSSRFGFRGQEDLGAGLSASFWLEAFLNLDTGVSSPGGFQRRSTVSLSHTNYGELRLGRDYSPTHSNWSRFDPFGYVGMGAVQLFSLSATGNTPVTAAFGTNPNTIQRANNGIQYLLPKNAWNVEGAIVRNFRENGLSVNDQHDSAGGRIGVGVGPVYVGIATLTTNNDITTGPFKDTALAASWDAPMVRLTAGVRRFTYLASTQNNYLIGASVPFGVHEVKFSWNRAAMGGSIGKTSIANDKTDQYALGYVYNLSKRTRLYSTLAVMNNKGNARFVVPGAPAGAAGASSRGFEMGINSDF